MDLHRRFGRSDPWKESVMRAVAIVAASEACGVEATEVNKGEKQEDGETKFWPTMAMIFVFAIVGACEFLTKLKVFP